MKEMSKKNFCLCLTRVSEASRRVDSLIKVVEDLKMALMAILLLHSDITINERKREKKKKTGLQTAACESNNVG